MRDSTLAILFAAIMITLGVTPMYSQSDTVSGLVFSENGTPIPNVPVKAIPENTNGVALPELVTQTDSAGRYRFEGIPPGTYSIRAGKDGANAISLRCQEIVTMSAFLSLLDDVFFNPATGKAELKVTNTSITTIVLLGPVRVTIPIASNAGVEIVMLKSAVKVSGHLVVPSGVTIPPLTAILKGTESRVTINTSVHEEGAFEFPYVPPGTYDLQVAPNLGFPTSTITVTDTELRDIELGRSAGVRVRGVLPPSDRSAFENIFPQWVYLVGRDAVDALPSTTSVPAQVYGDFEIPRLIPITQIVARDATGARFDLPMAPVSPDGQFEFLAVSPGSYSLRTSPDMGIANTTITVADGVVVNDVRVGEGVRVRGEIVPSNSGTRPPELINLTAAERGGQSVSAAVNENGSFEFPKVGPGTYRIFLDGKVRSAPSVITVGDEEIILRVEAPFKPWVTGRIVFAGPSLPPDSMASIRVLLTNGYSESAVKPDGSFKLLSNEGEYEFVVKNLPDGYVVKSVTYGAENLMNEPVKVDLSNPSSEILVTLEYRPGAP